MKILFLLSFISISIQSVVAQRLLGDMNNDNKLTIIDVAKLADVVACKDDDQIYINSPFYVDNSYIIGYYNGYGHYHFDENGIEEVSQKEYKYFPNTARIVMYKEGSPYKLYNVLDLDENKIFIEDCGKFYTLQKLNTDDYYIRNGVCYPKINPVNYNLPSGKIWGDKDLFTFSSLGIELTLDEVEQFLEEHTEFALPTFGDYEEAMNNKCLNIDSYSGPTYWTADTEDGKYYAIHYYMNLHDYSTVKQVLLIDRTEKCRVKVVYK